MSNTPHDLQKIQGVEKQEMDQAFKDSLKGFMSKDTQIQKQIEEAVERYEKFIIEVTDESKWIDGKPVFNGYKYVTLANAIKHFFVEELTTIASKSAEVERENTLIEIKKSIAKASDIDLLNLKEKYIKELI